MDRKKPSLTSPWKVGFLVALLLVVTSLGVSYFITGTFGITWHWIHIGGLSPATWTFNTGAFLEEMGPLLVLTALLAFASYVLVAGAVRRYKAYVDSGVEYKQLLKSIKSIDDLEDDAILDRLKQHPELREFMMGIRHKVAAHEKNHGERERRPAPAAASAERDERPRLQSEAAMLASAIAGGKEAFASDIALTVPELKQIERAARNAFARASDAPAPVAAPAPATAPSPELESLRASVRATARSIRLDVDACTSGARELEAALGGVSEALKAAPAKPAASGNTGDMQKRVDLMVDALAALGEETKRIAIASAMQATGGPEADAIKVADELKTLAKRFNTVAQHWRETAPTLKQALGGGNGDRPVDGKAAAAASSAIAKTRLWTERTIAMAEHARSLERAIGAVDREQADTSRAAVSNVDLADEPVAGADVAPPAGDTGDEFITRNNSDMFASDDDGDVNLADVPGFEKEHRFFGDSAAATASTDDGFEVDRADDERFDVGSTEEPAVAAAPAAAEPQNNNHDNDGFLTGPRPVVSPKKIERPAAAKAARPAAPAPAPAPEPVPATATATATLDPDADAIDLYQLGAIDCVQTA
ncbi:MAG TPA: hypothetical protein VF247_01780 [Candidatus Krumholzibacteria bacterium]